MDYLVLKKTAESGLASGWTFVTIARSIEGEGDEALTAAIRQGYAGEGTYKALPWDDDLEATVGPPAPPEIEIVSRGAVRAEESEPEAA